MEPVATSLAIISAAATVIALATKASRALAARRQRLAFEDMKHALSTHDGKVWMRDYLDRLHRHDGGLSKSNSAWR